MLPHTRLNKCLFGGALVAAGLVIHEAYAQEFVFIESNATASTVGVTDTFNGPGTWSVEASYTYFGYGNAGVSGMPTSLSLGAFGRSDTGTPTADASVVSLFTVTSNTSVTLETYLFSYGGLYYGNLTFTDMTTGIELFSTVDFDIGFYDFDLLADHEYRFSSATNNGYARLTINVPAPASALLFGLSGLLASRRRRC